MARRKTDEHEESMREQGKRIIAVIENKRTVAQESLKKVLRLIQIDKERRNRS